jgi:hypothetical protein
MFVYKGINIETRITRIFWLLVKTEKLRIKLSLVTRLLSDQY